MFAVSPPASEEELMVRSRRLAGKTLAELAELAGRPVPQEPRRAKGWPGELIEAHLGATAASLAEPDFQNIGVELKTIPIGRSGRPRESTYVCTVPLTGAEGLAWEDAWVRRKLLRVLWLPVEAHPDIPLAARRVGSALLWSLEPDLEAVLRTDWEEIMELVALGRLDQLSARQGIYLQVRPKAANSRSLRRAIGAQGERVLTNPRGFYLRASFTQEILRRHYAQPA